jgi:hypothetical protein
LVLCVGVWRAGGGGRPPPPSRAALEENFEIAIGRAACEAYRATWNLGTNSAFALGLRETTENLDRVATMKNIVFWDIYTQSLSHRKHITSPLQSRTG